VGEGGQSSNSCVLAKSTDRPMRSDVSSFIQWFFWWSIKVFDKALVGMPEKLLAPPVEIGPYLSHTDELYSLNSTIGRQTLMAHIARDSAESIERSSREQCVIRCVASHFNCRLGV